MESEQRKVLKAILDASQQIDLHDHPINPNGWKEGIAMAGYSRKYYISTVNKSEKKQKNIWKNIVTDKQTDKELLKAD
jgi:hypothetical protein